MLRARNFGTDSGENAEALSALAEVLAEQGRFGDASTIAMRAVDVYDKMGAESHSVTRALAARSLVDAYVGQARWPDAIAVYDQIAAGLAADPKGLERLLQGNLTWSLAMVQGGRSKEAVGRLRGVRARLAEQVGEDRYETAEADGLLASALAATGDRDAALAGFSNALPTLLSRSKRSDTDDSTGTARELRLRFILDPTSICWSIVAKPAVLAWRPRRPPGRRSGLRRRRGAGRWSGRWGRARRGRRRGIPISPTWPGASRTPCSRSRR